jgi:hypothetical protein
MKVKLSEIIDVMQTPAQDGRSYLDLETGEVVTVMEEEFDAARSDQPVESFPDWDQGPIAIARDVLGKPGQYLELPTSSRDKELQLMNRFRESVADPLVSEALKDAIEGDGAVRGFKNVLFKFGLGNKWFSFRSGEYKAMAVGWCEEKKIEYAID